jgi:hydroxylamine reductase
MEQLLEQTQGTGVDVYTHSEMLPANYYPAFKKYEHFVGNYGNAWWKQTTEFVSFKGPILFTTNCIVPPRTEEVRDRIFTTGAAGFPGCTHIVADENGKKDFSAIIEMAKTLPPPVEIETGKIVGGFATRRSSRWLTKSLKRSSRSCPQVLRHGGLRWPHEVP